VTEVYKALLKVQSKLGSLTKDEKNPFFNSSYVSLNAVREYVVGPLTEAELVLTQPTIYKDGKTFVHTKITHAPTGEMIEGFNEVIAKNMSDAQQVGSGISYARRYGLMSLLCLSAEEDDGNLAAERTLPKENTVVPMTPKKISFSTKKRDEL
jgi:hypothetical protein